jgi:hypothetical protein
MLNSSSCLSEKIVESPPVSVLSDNSDNSISTNFSMYYFGSSHVLFLIDHWTIMIDHFQSWSFIDQRWQKWNKNTVKLTCHNFGYLSSIMTRWTKGWGQKCMSPKMHVFCFTLGTRPFLLISHILFFKWKQLINLIVFSW